MIGGLCGAGAAGLAAGAGLCPAPAGASFGIAGLVAGAGLCPAPADANGVCCTAGGAGAGLGEPDFLV